MPNRSLVANNWDKAYSQGKYDQEGPIPLVAEIIEILKTEGISDGLGYYPGCGNGRNLVPLVKAGLTIEATDISTKAIEQLKKRLPSVNAKVADFLDKKLKQYDYLLSIQLFQHTDTKGMKKLFQQSVDNLKTGGILVLRVNSVHTQIIQKYDLIDISKHGGMTIQYHSGQKDGQHIHFYTAEELHALTVDAFDIIVPLREEFIARDDGTYWVQWETILRKHD